MSRLVHCVYFLVALGVLTTPVHTDATNKDACDQWTSIALKVTGSGKLHKCSARSPNCTGMDCSGSTKFSHEMYPEFLQKDIDLSYCFGIQINSCNDPLSMDFYLQLPSRNISKIYRITDDDVIELKDLNFSLGPLGTAYPAFNFQFERGDTKSVNLSVTAQLKSSNPLTDIVLEGFKFTLINDQVIPVKPCAKMIQDSNKIPPATFLPDKCQTKPSIPATTVAPSVTGKPSDTLNKPCGLDQDCAVREMCKISSPVSKCVCSPEFTVSPKGDFCITSSKVNKSCSQSEECGPNEECKGGTSNQLTCQCKQHFVYSTAREICTIPLPGHTTETPALPSSTPNKQTQSTTTESHKAEPVKAKASDNKHNIAMFVGGGLATAAVIVLVIVGSVCYMRRRRRPLSINDRESSTPLIGSDDNLIM